MELLWVGVAPAHRQHGLASALLAAQLESGSEGGKPTRWTVRVGVAERDVIEPLPLELRQSIAGRLFGKAGFVAVEGRSRNGARTFTRG